MSKPNWKDKIKRSPTQEAIESLMESVPVPVDSKPTNVNVDVNENVDVDVNVDVNVNDNVSLKRPKRMKFEEQYTRQTYYIHNDILTKLHAAAGDEKGEKTRIINEALKRYLKK